MPSNAPSSDLQSDMSRYFARLLPQLETEHNLLRRLIYKNKNQHHAQRWWHKIVEVDKSISKVVGLSSQLRDETGIGREKAIKAHVIEQDVDSALEKLLGFPHCYALIRKSISAQVKAAATLKQAIETRAFLAVTVLFVSLISRLHAFTNAMLVDVPRIFDVTRNALNRSAAFPDFQRRWRQIPKSLREALEAQTSRGISAKNKGVQVADVTDFGLVIKRQEKKPWSPYSPQPKSGLPVVDLGNDEILSHNSADHRRYNEAEGNLPQIEESPIELQATESTPVIVNTAQDDYKPKKKKRRKMEDEIDAIFS